MATYCVWSARPGTSVGTVAGSVPTAGEWDNAYVSLNECLLAITEAADDVIYLAHDHNATYAAAVTISTVNTGSKGIRVLSIDRLNTTTATKKYGAIEHMSSVFAMGWNGNTYVYGLTWRVGTGGIAANWDLNLANTTVTNNIEIWDNCDFWLHSASTGSLFIVGNTDGSVPKYIEFRNCRFRWGWTGNMLFNGAGEYVFINCKIHPSSSAPSVMFNVAPNRTNPHVVSYDCDWSLASALVTVPSLDNSWVEFYNCKSPTSILSGSIAQVGSAVVELHACANGDSILGYYRADGTGIVKESTTIYLTTGGSQAKQADGASTPYSVEIAPSTNVSKYLPVYSPWVSVPVGATGSKTFSMKAAYDNATVSQDTELWLEVEYYGDASSPKSTVEVSAPTADSGIFRDALVVGSSLTDTAVAWTGTGGWANKKTHTLSKAVTVNQIGYARCRVGVARQVTTYIDNTVTVS